MKTTINEFKCVHYSAGDRAHLMRAMIYRVVRSASTSTIMIRMQIKFI